MADRQVTWYTAVLSAIIISVVAGIGSKDTLKLLKLDVPRWANLRSSVTLKCQYDLDGTSLYSVKWYKDEHEFFRYSPELNPKTLTFNVDGVIVIDNKTSSNGKWSSTEVTLSPLSRTSEGSYKCEVSADAPNFPIDVAQSNMTVIAFPENIEKIHGVRQSYAFGEYVEANCTAKMTYPVAQITWYINNAEAESFLLERYSPEKSDGPFYNVTLGLKFPLNKESVDTNKKTVEIKCVVKLAGAEASADVANINIKPVNDHTLSQERLLNSGVVITYHWAIILTIIGLHYYGTYNY